MLPKLLKLVIRKVKKKEIRKLERKKGNLFVLQFFKKTLSFFKKKEVAETQLSWVLLSGIGEYSHVRLPEVIERKLQQALAETRTRVKQNS